MRHHDLKVWPVYFEEIAEGRLPFSIRDNEGRAFQKGDTVTLWEWDPNAPPAVSVDGTDHRYTGRCISDLEITYVEASWGLQPGKVALAFGSPHFRRFIAQGLPPKVTYGDQ
jgi:hypothetical protein